MDLTVMSNDQLPRQQTRVLHDIFYSLCLERGSGLTVAVVNRAGTRNVAPPSAIFTLVTLIFTQRDSPFRRGHNQSRSVRRYQVSRSFLQEFFIRQGHYLHTRSLKISWVPLMLAVRSGFRTLAVIWAFFTLITQSSETTTNKSFIYEYMKKCLYYVLKDYNVLYFDSRIDIEYRSSF